jgi:tetratricopeptide (TPR) repeat protein
LEAPATEAYPQDEAAPAADEPFADGAAAEEPETVEDEIEEVDFFLQQSLYDEARDLLLGLMERHGEHPLILERLDHIDQEIAAAQLLALPAEEAALDVDVPEVAPAPVVEASVTVEDVVHEVKRTARARPQQEDPEAHHLLGAAYHEMGDYENAMREYDVALRLGGRQARYLLAIARTLSEKKQLDPAADLLREALRAAGLSAVEALAINFELGILAEKRGDSAGALHHFEKVMMQEPHYRDVRKRLERLRAPREAPAAGNDDFDKAFEDVFELPDEGKGRRRP